MTKVHIDTDLACKVIHYGTEIMNVLPGSYAPVELKKGRHKLTFRSLENPADEVSITYETDCEDSEDYIEVKLLPIRQSRIEKENTAKELAFKKEMAMQEEKRKEEEKERRIKEEAARARAEREAKIERQRNVLKNAIRTITDFVDTNDDPKGLLVLRNKESKFFTCDYYRACLPGDGPWPEYSRITNLNFIEGHEFSCGRALIKKADTNSLTRTFPLSLRLTRGGGRFPSFPA